MTAGRYDPICPAPLTEELEAYLKALVQPVLIVRASQGLLVFQSEMMAPRFECLAAATTLDTPGGHHCHLDGEVSSIAGQCLDWLRERALDA